MPARATLPRDLAYGPFRGSQAVGDGLVTRGQLQGPHWRRLFRGIYVSKDHPLDHRTWCVAADLLLDGRGAISGRSAAALYGVDVLPKRACVETTVPHSVRVRAAARLVVVRSPLPPADVRQWAGCLATTPLRTAFDIARRAPLIEAVVGVDAMLAARLVTRDALTRFAADRERWPGIRQIRKVLFVADAGAESPMETRLRLVLIAGRLPWPVTQYPLHGPGGEFVARLDLAYPQQRIGVEYEGDHHRSRDAFHRDLNRINAINTCGWKVLRFGAADVYRRPRRIVAMVRAALA